MFFGEAFFTACNLRGFLHVLHVPSCQAPTSSEAPCEQTTQGEDTTHASAISALLTSIMARMRSAPVQPSEEDTAPQPNTYLSHICPFIQTCCVVHFGNLVCLLVFMYVSLPRTSTRLLASLSLKAWRMMNWWNQMVAKRQDPDSWLCHHLSHYPSPGHKAF